MKYSEYALLLALGLFSVPTAGAVDVQAYVKQDRFGTIKISPDGDYYAATVPLADRTVLVIGRRADNKTTATINVRRNTHVADFHWVNPERLLVSMAEKFGMLDEPQLTGDLYAINVDGSKSEILVGQSVQELSTGTYIQPKKTEQVAAFLIDDLPNDDRNVVISVQTFDAEPYTRAERMDVYTGRRVTIAKAPVRRASFTTDHQGVVRFALGKNADNVSKLYYRESTEADWRLINDEDASRRVEAPLGFSADDRTAYLQIEHPQGPDSIVALDLASDVRRELLRDDDVDPARIIYSADGSAPVGAWYMDGKPRTAFFDDKSPEARQYRSLEAGFTGETPFITSSSTDGRYGMVVTSSDRNPGDFYVFDNTANKASHLISRRSWFDPAAMAAVKPISLVARDGTPLNGYLTLPAGSAGKALPLVVLPHGGPFGIRDEWNFDSESQLLAAAGYGVLQVNFRGSGGYGRAFNQAGAREWGGKMQDDVTDATRWAIQQGIADPGRICIYGASYGAYAAMVGAAKEPGLYQCAAGYVGVYDLPQMHGEDSRRSRSSKTWANEWVGEVASLAALSPTGMADRIKVPVFLAAGGEDVVAPIGHTRKMEKALKAAGVPVETLYYDTEGHGFYEEAHSREYYTRLLAFLAKSLGGSVATAGSGAAAASK